MVRVPPPFRVTAELPIISWVPFPAELRVMVPAFEMLLPRIVRLTLLLRLQVSPEPTVKLLMLEEISSVTFEPAAVITALLLLPGGVPRDQFDPRLQLPVPPFQLSLVIAGGFDPEAPCCDAPKTPTRVPDTTNARV